MQMEYLNYKFYQRRDVHSTENGIGKRAIILSFTICCFLVFCFLSFWSQLSNIWPIFEPVLINHFLSKICEVSLRSDVTAQKILEKYDDFSQTKKKFDVSHF